jgi:hypothetical protein
VQLAAPGNPAGWSAEKTTTRKKYNAPVAVRMHFLPETFFGQGIGSLIEVERCHAQRAGCGAG